MKIFTMIKNKQSNLYYILEDGTKVKNDVFIDKNDFIGELNALGIDNYKIIVK